MTRLKVKVLVIEEGGFAEVRDVERTLESMQALVGGDIEAVGLGENTMYINEMGKYTAGMGLNHKATTLVEHFHPGFQQRDHIVGPAVILGMDASGNDTDVPQVLVDLVDVAVFLSTPLDTEG